MSDIELLTRQQVEKFLGIRRSTVYKLMREGRLPTPIQISRGCVRWRRSELEECINSKPKAIGEVGQSQIPHK